MKSPSICTGTAIGYVNDTKQQFARLQLIDPFYDPAEGGRVPIIQKILDVQSQWETLPSRRDPFTKRMPWQLAHKCPEEQVAF